MAMRGSQILAGALALGFSAASGQEVKVDWTSIQMVSRTTATLQVVVNPPLRRGSAIHDRVFAELQNLGADYVRYVPWLPYPRLAVAELEPPSGDRTFWDFSLIDPMTVDFLNATSGHSTVLNFSTIPAWMFVTPQRVDYPAEPDAVTWSYTQGTELRDPTGREVGDYFARLVSWYANGGFTDEVGVWHDSGHHFPIPYWEVLNEPDLEHGTTAEQYTARYDAIVSAIHKVSPSTRFVGISLAYPGAHPEYFEYFLNPQNHGRGIPRDMISYHFYASPSPGETPEVQQYTFFTQADGFITTVRYIESIRRRLSPETRTTVNEIGCISDDDFGQGAPGYVRKGVPDSYWNLCGAVYAYVYGRLAQLGIDVAGESQLVGYPTQFPSVSLVDWTTGAPNARFRVLELLKEHFRPGDKIVASSSGTPDVYALAFVCSGGEHRLLLVNKRERDVELTLPGSGELEFVDQNTKGDAPGRQTIVAGRITLHGFSVAVATLRTE
ncbi:MAG: glycosyl hydrolase family 39 [Gemmatimonadales bacterium]|jgi:hypothetical protein